MVLLRKNNTKTPQLNMKKNLKHLIERCGKECENNRNKKSQNLYTSFYYIFIKIVLLNKIIANYLHS